LDERECLASRRHVWEKDMQNRWARAALLVAGIAGIGFGVFLIGMGVTGFNQTRERDARLVAIREQSKQLQVQIDQLKEQLKNMPAPK
jgi:hypothetical protein